MNKGGTIEISENDIKIGNQIFYDVNENVVTIIRVLEKEITNLQKQNTESKEENFKLQARSDRVINNWNKLKEWLEDTIEQYGGFAKYRFESVYNKMQEIEGGMNE